MVIDRDLGALAEQQIADMHQRRARQAAARAALVEPGRLDLASVGLR